MGDSTCITFTGSGSAANPFVASPIVDPDPVNNLSCGPDGLLSQVPESDRCPVGCRIGRTDNGTIATDLPSPLIFDEGAIYFEHGNFYSVADPTKLTAPESGIYVIGFHGYWAFSDQGRRTAQLRLNASTFLDVDSDSAALAGGSCNRLNTVYPLVAGDFVEVILEQTSGGDLDIIADGAASPIFYMYKWRPGDCP